MPYQARAGPGFELPDRRLLVEAVELISRLSDLAVYGDQSDMS
jgi:hypothetical protein